MDYRYYVSDDLRLRPWKRKEAVYSDLDEAINHYLDLPPSVVKAIGLVAEDGLRVLELVRCLQLFPTDVAGESVFMVEPFFDSKWSNNSEVLDIGHHLVKRLDIRRCLLKDQLIPIPTSNELPESMNGVYLWRDKTNDPESAIHQVYLAGEGWRSMKASKRLYPDSHRTFLYPLVLMYRVDVVNAKNQLEELEVTPWDYELLNHRTEVRVIQNKKKQEEKMKRDAPMDVEVRIFGPSEKGKELANASVTLNGCFAIHGIQIKEGRNGPFVSMPRREVKGEWKDYCFPCTKEFKQQFDESVLDAYQQKFSQKDGLQTNKVPAQEAEEAQVAPRMTM